MAFPSSQLPALCGSLAEAVNWQHQLLAPRSRSAALYLWREVCTSAEKAQGNQLRVLRIILDIFHLLLGKVIPEMGGGEAGLSRDPQWGRICSCGPGLGACHAPFPIPGAGRVSCLP